MRTVEYWRWHLLSETSGKRVASRWHMTEADALARDPAATRVPGSLQLRHLPEAGEHVPAHFNPGGPPKG